MSKWRVILEKDPETGDFAVWCPELPGCTSCGETEEQALKNIKEAIEKLLKKYGFELISQKGSHRKWRDIELGLQVNVPELR